MTAINYFLPIFCLILSCTGLHCTFGEPKLFEIPETPQREGDPEKGRKYLLEGDYLDSGIPVEFMNTLPSIFKSKNLLGRTGLNASLPPEYTATKAANGVDIIAPNCLTCHGGYLLNDYIIGLGNHSFDGTMNAGFAARALGFMIKSKYPEGSPERQAFSQFNNGTIALSNHIKTESVGANSADRIAEVLIAHREFPGLKWSAEPLLEISDITIPADPPAWWLLKKKNAQFTTGIGRGDFARISTASSLLTMSDISKVQEIDQKFADVIAFIKSIKPPIFPEEINLDLTGQGSIIFKEKCSKCHGSYGEEEIYPNYLVHLDVVQTDPTLAESFHERKDYVDLYNDSWFGRGEHSAHIVPGHGYVAPPLDGVWATAPYLHNGSVPTVRALLDSKSRPTYWKRSFDPKDYDCENLGWNYEEKKSKLDKYTYDATIKGYGNQGHYFGDELSGMQRDQIIEYLKTL